MENRREKLINVFSDTLMQCSSNEILQQSVKNSIVNTVLYRPDDYPDLEPPEIPKGFNAYPIYGTTTKEKTVEACIRIYRENQNSKIGILNFANGFVPGGGVTNGASAQEEDLCRCSTLYPVIKRSSKFYQINGYSQSKLSTDVCLYSPDIIIFKNDNYEMMREYSRL